MNTLTRKLTSSISSLLIRRENGSEHVRIDAAGEEAADSAFSSPRRTHSNQDRPRLARKADPADVAAMDDEIKKIVQDSIDFAEQSPELPLEALMEDILVETTS